MPDSVIPPVLLEELHDAKAGKIAAEVRFNEAFRMVRLMYNIPEDHEFHLNWGTGQFASAPAPSQDLPAELQQAIEKAAQDAK